MYVVLLNYNMILPNCIRIFLRHTYSKILGPPLCMVKKALNPFDICGSIPKFSKTPGQQNILCLLHAKKVLGYIKYKITMTLR